MSGGHGMWFTACCAIPNHAVPASPAEVGPGMEPDPYESGRTDRKPWMGPETKTVRVEPQPQPQL